MESKIEKQENLRFDGVKIHSVNFNILGSSEENTEIDLDIVPKVMFKTSTQFNIIYEVNLSVDDVFTLNLKAVGYFELSEDLLDNENIKNQLIHSNAPAIVFPYLRSFISMFTSNLGTIPTLTIPTQFFKGNIEEYAD
jgi:preprotein translocase subunit SecB